MGLQDWIVDPKKPPAGQPGLPKKPEDDLGLNSTVDEFFTRLQSDMRHPSPSQESIAAAMQTMNVSQPKPREIRPQSRPFLRPAHPCARPADIRTVRAISSAECAACPWSSQLRPTLFPEVFRDLSKRRPPPCPAGTTTSITTITIITSLPATTSSR